MKIPVTGADGFPARWIIPRLSRSHQVETSDRATMDVTDAAGARQLLERSRPDLVWKVTPPTSRSTAGSNTWTPSWSATATPHEAVHQLAGRLHQRGFAVTYLDLPAQEKYLERFPKLKSLIPYNSDNRRNIDKDQKRMARVDLTGTDGHFHIE